jgi:hypothetical protein
MRSWTPNGERHSPAARCSPARRVNTMPHKKCHTRNTPLPRRPGGGLDFEWAGINGKIWWTEASAANEPAGTVAANWTGFHQCQIACLDGSAPCQLALLTVSAVVGPADRLDTKASQWYQASFSLASGVRGVHYLPLRHHLCPQEQPETRPSAVMVCGAEARVPRPQPR